jgi:hypothetical protein
MEHPRFSFILLLLMAVIGISACAGPLQIPIPVVIPTEEATLPATIKPELSTGEGVASDNSVTDAASLVDALRAAGATAEPVGEVEQPFFPVSGQVIQVNGEDVQVFAFADPETARTQAEQLPEDGSSFPTLMITWIAPPHFFQQGQVIVLYVGDNIQTLDLLQSVLGPQVAGR